MNLTYELIEKAKVNNNIESDYAISNLIGVTRQMVSNWKAGKSEASAVNTLKLIKAAGLSVDDALNLMTEKPYSAGGALSRTAKQCILCKIIHTD